MHDPLKEDHRQPQDTPALAPPLRLAGIDEDDTAESHLVRGID
ncbi:surface protein [Streptomyces sp. NBC_01334]|nr:surface protein [Streptomyces sp. NBC_01334]WSN45205.1 surface protein [Streptomyces sp. NBC_01334]